MIITFMMFLHKQRTLSAVIYFSVCAISFVAFVCISIIRLHSHVVREIMFVWLYQTTRTWFLMNVMHSRFYVTHHIYIYLKKKRLLIGGFCFIR